MYRQQLVIEGDADCIGRDEVGFTFQPWKGVAKVAKGIVRAPGKAVKLTVKSPAKGVASIAATPYRATGAVLAAPGKALAKALPKPLKPIGTALAFQGVGLQRIGNVIAKPSSAGAQAKAHAASAVKTLNAPVIKYSVAGAGMIFGVPPTATLAALASAQVVASQLDRAANLKSKDALMVIDRTLLAAGKGDREAIKGLTLLNAERKKQGLPPLMPKPSMSPQKRKPFIQAPRALSPVRQLPSVKKLAPAIKRLAPSLSAVAAARSGFAVTDQGAIAAGKWRPDPRGPMLRIAGGRRVTRGRFSRA